MNTQKSNLFKVMNPEGLMNPEFEFMMSCLETECIFFADCFKIWEEFNWRSCFIGSELGGMFSDKYSVEEKAIHWNIFRDKKTRGTFKDEFREVDF